MIKGRHQEGQYNGVRIAHQLIAEPGWPAHLRRLGEKVVGALVECEPEHRQGREDAQRAQGLLQVLDCPVRDTAATAGGGAI